ncbi:MAG TPA: TIM barrel protein [Acidimicrobiales bacterium]|nr:TIM barrel protein [Acidimicrobiales bacterium]
MTMTEKSPGPQNSATSASRIRLGSAPDSWGVWFANDSAQMPWEQFLDELVEAEYRWIELGPHGYLPTDPVRLSEEIGGRGLRVSGGGVEGALHSEARFAHDLEQARKVAALLQATGGRYLVYLPRMYRDLSGAFVEPATLEPEDWRRLVKRVSEVGRIVRDEFGISLVFHPHADSHVCSQAEVERFVNETDPASVSLCLDTGHISYGGGDNLELIRQFPDRIGYVHLKQVDPVILNKVRTEGLSFSEAVRLDVACEPPNGVPKMEPLVAALEALDVDLFAIVEQDMYPCDPSAPLPIAKRTRRYYGSCGLGPGTFDSQYAK